MGLGQAATILFQNADGDYVPVSEDNPLPTSGSGGGGGGAVDSVNGQTGAVVLDAEDVGARPDDWEPDLSGYAETDNLAAVAFSGAYNDLQGTPTIPDLSGYATETYVDNSIGSLSGSDLPVVDGGSVTIAQQFNNFGSSMQDALDEKADIDSLADVATSGQYSDLSGLPTIPDVSGLASEAYVDSAVADKVGSGNDSITGIEMYDSVDDLPTSGTAGVLYVVPVAGA